MSHQASCALAYGQTVVRCVWPMIKLEVDGHGVELRAYHDLSWLKEYGRVFCVFDRLISGNLCLGTEKNGEKLFIKYAGAPTVNFAGSPQRAVNWLREAEEKYHQLKHPKLSAVVSRINAVNGFGLVFKWFEGFALAPLEARMRELRGLPLSARLFLYDGLADFMAYASGRDYVLSGFSDRHLMIDLIGLDALVCSADDMLQMPAVTPYPKMPGSPWYIPPEGYLRGARLNEQSNVYIMGALAFTFFGNRSTMDKAGWEAGSLLYDAAKQAVSEHPGKRQETALEFLSNWRSAVMRLPA